MIDVPILGGRLRSNQTLIMGILNATPDSFSDGGELDHAAMEAMVAAGPDIIDVGGESTRPGHETVPVREEVARVVPVIQSLREQCSIPISIDTSKPEVARAALDAGANFVNDVNGLLAPGMAELVAEEGCAAVLMRHRDLTGPIVKACEAELASLVAAAKNRGVLEEQIILDPGLGFGARPGADPVDNFALIDDISYAAGAPVLIGGSRKRFVGEWMGEPDAKKRLRGSLEVVRRARIAGAAIVRVHDVLESRAV
ncbi:MAG: dihydropteroate synthase [Thermoplasmatota archaeon]